MESSCNPVHESENEAIQLLEKLNIECPTFQHAHAFTVVEQDEIVKGIPGKFTKNLFVKDKKYGMYLLTVAHDRDVDLKLFASNQGLSGSNFRFCDEATLQEKLKITKGSVGPLALLHDVENVIKFCIDGTLLEADIINSHPLRNDRTTSLTPQALLTFLEHINHPPIILDFSKMTSVKKLGVEAPTKKHESSTEEESGKNLKRETLLGVSATRENDFSTWYTQVLTLSEMIDYSDISGCYILRPWSFFIWEEIQKYLDAKFKTLGVKNSYFPLFVSETALNAEKEHIEGFAPEVAWVTKSGTSDLAVPIAIRPTSETIMYPFFAKWIRSHRDLPLELNQWNNVVRWEFKDATPFLRSREFLWQEGHTAHTTYEEAQERVLSILEFYKQAYEELLAVPVIKGAKTEKEKFAGALHTTTVEAYINGSGRAIQGATSHNLGQNFGKIFKIAFENDVGERSIPWQTSWGFTTRSIGVAVMVHGDNKGLVLPPRVAPIQVIILPIASKNVEYTELLRYSDSIESVLKAAGIRADNDRRQNYTPGWKFNHWEQKGVPVRIEVGPRDMASQMCRIVRRDTGEKLDVPVAGLHEYIANLLNEIHTYLFTKASIERDQKIVRVTEWKDFVPALNDNCLAYTPFCDIGEWEERVKVMSRDEALCGSTESATVATSVAAKTLCKPFDQPPLPEGTKCFVSGLPATTWILWGRSY